MLITLKELSGKNIKMKKIIVLGALGMAGHIMSEYLDSLNEYEVLGVARTEGKLIHKVIDVSNFSDLEEYLNKVKPDFVINCIGILVQQSKDNLSTAILINSYLPHFLAELGKQLNYKLIQISTDCVYSGKDGQYTENSFRDGDDNYARTKALGEVINDKDLTIRTSIIGPGLKTNSTGLLDWFFKQSVEVKGYTKAYWTGVTTLELAKATHQFIQQNITGLYHLCPEHKISKFDLLKIFAKVWHKEIRIIPFADYTVDKSLVCTRTDFKYIRHDYLTMLNELKAWVDNHPTYYTDSYKQ